MGRAIRPKMKGSLGVRHRGKEKSIHLEVRTGSRGCCKIHVTGFGRDGERANDVATMAYDVAKLCCLMEPKYLTLPHVALNFSKSRGDVAAMFREDARMVRLRDAHRLKDEMKENWNDEMKTTLHELALDALLQLGDTAQAAAEAQAIDSQIINVGYVDEEPSFDIDAGLASRFVSEDGAAPVNWALTKEALRSIEATPELLFSLEDQLDMAWDVIARLEEENKMLRAKLTSQRFPEIHGLQSSGDY